MIINDMNFSFFFFFKQKTAYEIVSGDWSSDVCSSDLQFIGARRRAVPNGERVAGLDEVHAHGTAHQAETDEPDLFGGEIQESPPRRRLAFGREQLATRKKIIVAELLASESQPP